MPSPSQPGSPPSGVRNPGALETGAGERYVIPAPLPAEQVLPEVLGYLNFSNGKPDPRFQAHLARLHLLLVQPDGETPPDGAPFLAEALATLDRLSGTSAAFRESQQARAVLELVFRTIIPAYRAHHADLLFHLSAEWYYQPYFVARVCEATLAQGGPWTEVERITKGTLQQLNDFLGHRPLPVLENGRRHQPYDHERFRPIPVYLRGAGIALGKYAPLLVRALGILDETPRDLLAGAYFDPDHLDEIAIDVRAYDHSHPVYKRTNYTFGEWDPHLIDTRGFYRRFVLRTIILDALLEWMAGADDLLPEERLVEASAVLAGTILMASAISGAGPDTHDSSVSLTTLLPKIARQRDAYYQRLLQSLSGPHAERLRREAHENQQPLGRIRQHLNLHLAHYGCRQMQRAHLAEMYARMGQPEAARDQALIIPSTSARFETEVLWRIASAWRQIEQGLLAEANDLTAEIVALLHRGIHCGAFVDPWNILAFQGQFPLFQTREDSVADQRIERLLSLMEGFFGVMSRLVCEAAAAGKRELCEAALKRFQEVAEFWDRFATTVVAELPPVKGGEAYQSAAGVVEVLLDWNRAGEAAGDIAFWRNHLDRLGTAKSYAIVVDVLLRRGDTLAAMNLLLQWLSEQETVELEQGPHAFHGLARDWFHLVLPREFVDAKAVPKVSLRPSANTADPSRALQLLRRFFDGVEAGAGTWWHVPAFEGGELRFSSGEGLSAFFDAPPPNADDELSDAPVDPTDEQETDDLFEAAYENVVYRDSAQDGHQGETMDEGPVSETSPLEMVAERLDARLRFLGSLGESWREAAVGLSARLTDDDAAKFVELGTRWRGHLDVLIKEAAALLESIANYEPAVPSGDPDAMLEYDRDLHAKFALLNMVAHAVVGFTESRNVLHAALSVAAKTPLAKGAPKTFEATLAGMYQAALVNDAERIRFLLPRFIKELTKRPLLYIPFDKGGRPKEVVAARNLQQLLRFWLARLPRWGLLRETGHLLRTAFVMERSSPPAGMSITEFDRLMEVALRSTLESLVECCGQWADPEPGPQELVECAGSVVEQYLKLWLKHSATMRLSTLEALKPPGAWRETRDFIRKYGGELFHTRVLTLGNLRAIVHQGAGWYLDYLRENEDPLHPLKVLEDLDAMTDDEQDDLADQLELVFRCLVEKFDRFLEYNSTTTQSDYGEKLHCLLDFLRLEVDYERYAWDLHPLVVAHDVLSRGGRTKAAAQWERLLRQKTAPIAREQINRLRRLEKTHGIRLPSVSDRLNEKFVKPLSLDRILARIRPAMRDAARGRPSRSFAACHKEIEKYLSTSSGSALELQPWLQEISDEVRTVEVELRGGHVAEGEWLRPPQVPVGREKLAEDLGRWEGA
jgi:hypothetical protein